MTVLYGQGTKIGYTTSPGVSAVYTQLSQTFDVTPPQASTPMTPTTDLDSTAVTKRPGLTDFGTAGFKQFYDPRDTGCQAMITALANKTLLGFQITYTDTGATHSTVTFSGYLVEYNQSGFNTDNKNVEVEAKIEITGTVTYTTGT